MLKAAARKAKTRSALFFMTAALLLAFTVQPVSTARADLLILPIRLVFKPHERLQALTLMNTSQQASMFRLALYYQKQTENSGYQIQDGPIDPKYDVAKWITFSPRQVELPAGASQAVRLSLRRPADLPDGEYRVHLRLQRLGKGQAQGPSKQGQMTMHMYVNVGFSVPVMVRQGKYDATATISDFKFTSGTVDGKTPPKVNFYLNRGGKYSTLGKVDIFWTPPGGGEEKHVGLQNSVNVFTEVTRRSVEVPLDDKSVYGGTFRIVYQGDDIDKDAGIFDQKTFSAK